MNRQDAKYAKPEPAEELDAAAYAVIGAAIEVHRTLGPGYLERVYQRALAVELTARSIHFRAQVPLELAYKGKIVGNYRLDFVVDESLIIEIKAVDSVLGLHRAQLMTYLKAGAYQLGLLINFNVPILKDGLCRMIWNG